MKQKIRAIIKRPEDEIGVITEIDNKLNEFQKRIEAMKMAGAWDRGELIDLFNWMIPEFNHKETGKFLDGRM